MSLMELKCVRLDSNRGFHKSHLSYKCRLRPARWTPSIPVGFEGDLPLVLKKTTDL
jgi:hypothetical protein